MMSRDGHLLRELAWILFLACLPSAAHGGDPQSLSSNPLSGPRARLGRQVQESEAGESQLDSPMQLDAEMPAETHSTPKWDLKTCSQSPRDTSRVERRVTFELSFANRDLIWLGDPGSPTASVYVKPGAQPIASDVQIATLTEKPASSAQRYLREARLVAHGDIRAVHAFTTQRELVIGTIDKQGAFTPNEAYQAHRKLLPSWPADPASLVFDPQAELLYVDLAVPGPVLSESLDFLPLTLVDEREQPIEGRYAIEFAPAADTSGQATTTLMLHRGEQAIELASGRLPRVFRRADVQLGSFDNRTGAYLSEAAYRPGGDNEQAASACVTFEFPGEFAAVLHADRAALTLPGDNPATAAAIAPPAQITIDGQFDDWRNVAGVDDARGDLVPYLEYVPDVDLLEFKVAHDEQHIYLYARVAGQVGRSHPAGGRAYFYAYMDVDQNPQTGFLPTRDDDCYFGVDIGDDCEVQFEFVDNALRKTFYGFCGLGGNDNVLQQAVTLGRSQYGRFDEQGVERANYKAEYIFRDGITEITEDLKLGTSDSIRLAVSPDGREVEIVSDLAGFLKDPQGRPTLAPGQIIDVAAGMECDSRAYPGKTRWAADSTIAIRGYRLAPLGTPTAAE